VHGMKGGMILVEGDAGDEVGASLRRGIIAVSGRVGDFCGVNAAAGTIVVGGRVGARAGAAMRRATIVTLGPAPDLLPTFHVCGTVSLTFLKVLARHLESHGFSGAEKLKGRFVRSCGDMVSLGKGEILYQAD
ncbi:MAG: formylmethanofuran dehydrogenase subunit C, partial [Planctomycetaceae bacterium]